MNKCGICINKTECDRCDKNWRDKFIPNEKVRHYFSNGYVSTMGIDGRIWRFNTTKDELIPTKSVVIDGNEHYCAYCCEPMFIIQDKETLEKIGRCCLCDGAISELEYNEKLKMLKTEYNEKLGKLHMEYKDKLKINVVRLFEIKQEKDKKNFDFFNRESESSIHIKENEIDIKELTFGVKYD